MTGRRTSACALALVLAAGATGLASVPATATPPQVAVEPTSATAGQQLAVTLTGWPAGNVQLEICGNRAGRGSVDCATTSARQLYVPGGEPVTGRIMAMAPPVACPCVIRVRALDSGDHLPPEAGGSPGVLTGSATVEILDSRAPLAPAGPEPARLRITGLSVEPARQDWRCLFGLPSEFGVELRIHNVGSVDIAALRLSLLTGRPGQPTTVVEAPEPTSVRAGESRTIRITVPVDSPGYGRYAVHGQVHTGEVTDLATGMAFVVVTERYPWGWAAIAGALVLFLLARQVIGLISDGINRHRD